MPQIRYGVPQMQYQPPPQPPRRQLRAPVMGAAVLSPKFPQVRYGAGASALTRSPQPAAMPGQRMGGAAVPQVRYGQPPTPQDYAATTAAREGGAGGPWPGMYSGYSVSPERKRPAGGIRYGAPAPATYGDWRDDAARWATQHGGNPQDMIRRVVDVYMNPNDPRAADNPYSALANAKTDDVWAQAFSTAIGRPPNEVEWDEHYYAQNYGSRDPLEGHPEAVQFIQAEYERMHEENVREAQETWRNMMGQIQSGIYE